MKLRSAFTILELIFVIVIIAIIGKFGLEFIAQAYNNYIFSTINNQLQSESTAAVELLSKKLQHRIKSSEVARIPSYPAIALQTAGATTSTVLEWIGTDLDGFRGNSADTGALNLPNWSGIIDIDVGVGTNFLTSPETNTTATNNLIQILSQGTTTINNSALFFVGSINNSDINNFGWNGISALTNANTAMLPINSVLGNVTQFQAANTLAGSNGLAGVGIYEYYKLAWTAYAVVYDPITRNLTLFYDYQPWLGESYTDATTKQSLIMQNVSTFKYIAINSLIKIQVCVQSDLFNRMNEVGKQDYSICKEKTIF